MPNEMFRQITANIKNRKSLVESLPFCAETGKGIEIISGHHRTRAARAANIQELHVLLDKSNLSRDQIIAKQLAHNNIDGIIDKQLTAALFSEIKDIDSQIEAFVNPKDFDLPEPANIKIEDMALGIKFKTISFFFLPSQLEKFDAVETLISKDTNMVGIAPLEYYEKLRDTIRKVKDIEDIRSIGMIISKMCDIALEYYENKEEVT